MKPLVLILCLLLSGCSTISGWRDAAALKAGYTSKARAEQAVAQVRQDYAAKQAANDKIVADAQAAFTKGLNDREAFASAALYSADFAFSLNPHPDRTHIVMDNKINEARAVLPPPSVEAMVAANAEIKKLLDETQTSLEQLQAAHQATLAEAAQIKDRAVKAEADLAAAKQAKLDLEKAESKAIADKQADLNKANDAVIASEHARGDDAKARQAAIEKLSWAAGILAALCFAGAIFSPIFKTQLIMFGATMSVGAVGVWYLTPVVVLSIFGVGAAAVIIWVARTQHTDNKAAMSTYQALADLKDKNPDLWAKNIAPILAQWQTQYIKKDGAIVEVPDKTIALTIDKKLAAVGDK